MQSACLRLMGKKMLVSLAMEGKFTQDGLQSLEEDDDMLTAMARELVTEKGVGESADAVWRQIQAEHSLVASAAMTPSSGHSNILGVEPTRPEPPPDFDFKTAPTSERAAEQLSLFEF